MTLIFPFMGSSGSSDFPNCMSAPAPLAHQWSGLTPFPMNMTPKRFGNAARIPAWEVLSAADDVPKPDSDSSHGNAIVTPTPRRNVRRERRRLPLRREFLSMMFTFPQDRRGRASLESGGS